MTIECLTCGRPIDSLADYRMSTFRCAWCGHYEVRPIKGGGRSPYEDDVPRFGSNYSQSRKQD